MGAQEILLETGTNELEILEFYIDALLENGEVERNCFGVNVAKVMEIIEDPGVNPPRNPPHPCFMGAIPLRGCVLPVLDLGIWLGIPRKKQQHEVVIVTEFSRTLVGFLVSGVTEIHRLGWEEVESPSGYLGRIDINTIVGLVNVNDHFIQLLDLEYIIGQFDPSTRIGEKAAAVKAMKRYKAMVVDDSHMIRAMVRDAMQEANFDLTILSNGEEGLRHVEAMKDQAIREGIDIADLLNVVISDIEMPRMDGFTLTKRIKDDPILAKVPVILYSSLITPELRHKGESVKADEQVSKPDLYKIPEMAIELIERG